MITLKNQQITSEQILWHKIDITNQVIFVFLVYQHDFRNVNGAFAQGITK